MKHEHPQDYSANCSECLEASLHQGVLSIQSLKIIKLENALEYAKRIIINIGLMDDLKTIEELEK